MKSCIAFLAVLLAACSPQVVYLTPAGPGDVLPVEAQRVIDHATATAAAAATQAAQASATDQSARETSTAVAQLTQDALAVEQTRAALQLTVSAGAGLATDAASAKTQAAHETQAWATPTAAAMHTQAAVTSADTARAQADAASLAEFWQTVRTVCVALLIVAGLSWIAVTVIDRISRIYVARLRERAAIAREAFRLLPPGHWAEWQDGDGYRVYELPGPPGEPPTIVDNVIPNVDRAHAWRHAVRLFAWWGDRYGFGIASLGPAGARVVSDPDWRVLSKLLKEAGVLAEVAMDGKRGRTTAWAESWSFARLADELGDGRLALPFPAHDEAPKVAFAVPTYQQN